MTAPSAIPPGFRAVTPYLAVHHAHATIDFLKRAFDAEEVETNVMPDGRIMNAIIRIRDSLIFIGERPSTAEPWPAMLYMYVEETDGVFQRAVAEGGKVIAEPRDQFYGDRTCAIEDPSGNHWWIAAHIENLSSKELVDRAVKEGR